MADNTNGGAAGDTTTTPLLRSVVVEDDGGTDKKRSRPKEPWKGEFVKSIVYGGLDAIVTSFALISSISAGRLSSGFANLVADGISMGFGDFVSTSTERDVAAKERLVTEWDVTNHLRTQGEELLRQYQALGMDEDDATAVVNIFAKYTDVMVDEKMSIQKGILPPDQSAKPWKNGLVTFIAFLLHYKKMCLL